MSAGAQLALLDFANTKIGSGLDGEDGRKTFFARVLWVAHVASVLKRRGTPGFRSSQSSGGVSESFSSTPLDNFGEFGLSSYGVLYASLFQSSRARAGALLNRRVCFPGGRGDGGC